MLGNVTPTPTPRLVDRHRYYYAVVRRRRRRQRERPSRLRPAPSPPTTASRRRPASSTPASRPAPTARPRLPPWTLSGAPSAPSTTPPGPRSARSPAWIQGPATASQRRRGRDRDRRHDRQRRRAPLLGSTSTPPTSPHHRRRRRRRRAADRAFLSSSPPTAPSTSSPTARQRQRLHHERLHPGGHLHDRLDPVPHRLRLHEPRPTRSPSARAATDAWTQLKAAGATGYAIPLRGANTITATHGTLCRGYQNAQLWLDELSYSGTSPQLSPSPPSAGTGGSISPAGATTVAYGGSQIFTIAPASGYTIADVLVDGVSVGAVSSYTFTNVRTDHTIAATFAPASSRRHAHHAGRLQQLPCGHGPRRRTALRRLPRPLRGPPRHAL